MHRADRMRWLVAIAAAFLLGALGGAWVGLPTAARVYVGLGALVVGAGLVLWTGLRPASQRLVCIALIAVAGATGWVASASPPRRVRIPAGTARITADVERVDHGARGARAVLRVHEGALLSDRTARIDAGARLSAWADLPTGARVRVLARVDPAARYRNPTPHPPWPTPSRVDGRATLRGPPRILSRNRLAGALDAARARVRRSLTSSLSDRSAGVARALVLGESAALDDTDRQRVRDAGLSHVLAVSGLHVALVAGMLVLALRRILVLIPPIAARVDVRRLTALLGIGLAFGFALFAGAAPSALRAATTASIAWALVAFGRRPRWAAVAAFAAVVLGALSPDRIAQPGFVLSVAATAGVLGAYAPAERSALEWLKSSASVSFRATVATAPVVLYCFGDVPRVSVVANVVLVPVAALALIPLAIAHSLVATLLPDAAIVTATPFERLVDAFVAASGAFADLDPLGAPPPPDLAQGLIVAAACAAVLLVRRWRVRVVAVAVACLCLAGAELHLRDRERPTGVLRATFLDVGQGDATLLDMPDGRAILVDAGGVRSGPDPGRHVLVPLLAARRRDALSAIVVSHPHPDHFGGVPAVLDALAVDALWDTGQSEVETPEGPASAVVALARRRGAGIVRPASLCEQPARFGDARVQTLWPCPGYDAGWDPNDNSFVLRVSMGRRAFLLTGDIEAHAEAMLVASEADLRADVLKVAHHGSRTSSSDAFLARVDPSVAVVSCGRQNRFDHPHPEIVDRFATRDISMRRTDLHGGITVWTDGERLTVDAFDGAGLALE